MRFLGWLVDWSFSTITSEAAPPRDPDEDDDGEEEEDDDEQDEDIDPAVIREPDEQDSLMAAARVG
jgi:hypothetical protein